MATTKRNEKTRNQKITANSTSTPTIKSIRSKSVIYDPFKDPNYAELSTNARRTRLLEELSLCKTGLDFEKFVANLLKHLRYTQVEITKGSGDFGADIIANISGIKVAYQCKFYTSKVGISAIQEIISGMAYYDANRGFVITTSSFTPAAIKMAAKANITLYDGNRIHELIQRVN